MKTEPEVKNNHLIFGILMVIVAAAFTLLSAIVPVGDSSNFPGRAYRFAQFIMIQLQRIFPNQYGFVKQAQYWLKKLSEFLDTVVVSQSQQDYQRRATDKRNTEQELARNGK